MQASGQVEFKRVVRWSAIIQQLSDSTLIARAIFEDRLITCASPDYLGRCGVPANPQELEADHQILGYFSAATGEMWPLRSTDGGRESSFSRFDLAANDSAGLIRMMVAGLGVGQTHASVASVPGVW